MQLGAVPRFIETERNLRPNLAVTPHMKPWEGIQNGAGHILAAPPQSTARIIIDFFLALSFDSMSGFEMSRFALGSDWTGNMQGLPCIHEHPRLRLPVLVGGHM